MNELEKRVMDVFCDFSGFSRNLVTRETIIRDIGIDSIAFVGVIAKLEQEFGMELADENLDPPVYVTLGDVMDVFENKF